MASPHPLADLVDPALSCPPTGPPRTLHWIDPPPIRYLWGDCDRRRSFGRETPTGWRTWILRVLRWFARWF